MHQKGTIRDVCLVAVPSIQVLEWASPWSVGRREKKHWFALRGSKVACKALGVDTAFSRLQPLVAEDQPWGTVAIFIKRAVQAHPFTRSDGAVTPWREYGVGSIRPQHLCATSTVVIGERRKHPPRVGIFVDFWRPVLRTSPESRARAKSGEWPAPLFEINALVALEASSRAVPRAGVRGAEKQIPVGVLDDVGVSDVEVGSIGHGVARGVQDFTAPMVSPAMTWRCSTMKTMSSGATPSSAAGKSRLGSSV